MRNTNPALARAYELEQRGQLPQAIEAYQQLLAQEPDNSDALHLLGVALARTDRPQEALAALTAAARLQPDNAYLQTNLGHALGAAGRGREALAAYQRALAVQPGFLPALQAQGRTQLRLQEYAAAERSLAEAVRVMPTNATVHSDLGVALEQLGRPAEALSHFERATALSPNLAEAQHNLGLLHAAQGRLQPALLSLERALALQPQNAALHANRGNVLADLGRTSEALQSYERALALQPRNAAVLNSRGRLQLQTQPGQALQSFDAALLLEPADFNSHFERGVALALLERHTEALESFERALALNAHSAEVLNNRGVTLVRLDRIEEAAASFRRALEVAPENPQALVNGANTLATLGHCDEALQWFDRALLTRPQDAELSWGKARLLLSLGQFERGWPLYESRLELAHLRPLQRHVDLPRWSGQDISGKTLLVHSEQGLGDTLQFCRFVPQVEALGARVVFEVQPALTGILSTLGIGGQIRGVGESLPHFDLRSPLLSLPLLLGTRLQNIPAATPYLHADPSRIEAWRRQIAALPGLKVGIVWQGNPETEKQGGLVGRSFPLSAAAPLAQLPSVTLVSLQKGAGCEQLEQVAFRILRLMDPHDLSAEAVLDTAAVMSALDLVVTSDTAAAHLAGALNLQVWVMLPATADWRWLRARDDSPWYPSMRLFRQRRVGDWDELFARVAQQLARLSQEREGRA
jgi:tetratricopeptide (TPR) repeat protein